MANTRSYSAGAFALEIKGQFAGWLTSVEGGGVYGDVVETTSANGSIDKKTSGVKYDDIVVTCGAPDPILANWLTAFLKGQAPTHDGAVVFCDYNYQPVRRLEWDQGAIVALTFPALNAASKESAGLTVAIRPELTRSTKGSGATIQKQRGVAKQWLAANFSVAIPGVSCTKVSAVEPLSVTQELVTSVSSRRGSKPGPLHVEDLVLTVSESGGADFVTWHDDFVVRGNNGNAQEKSAALTFLSPDLKSELFSFRLQGVGIHRLEPSKQVTGVASLARLQASMYCEQAELVLPPPPPPAQPATPTPAAVTTDRSGNLRDYLGVRLASGEVTRRLMDTRDQPLVTSQADRQRQLGFDLGLAWAQRKASMAELEELAAMKEQEWSSIALPPGHSLGEVLEATGVAPLQYDGRLELSRDTLAEGILAGILKVMSEVQESIIQNLK